ncbi:MAG: hypothetical protein AAFV88_14455 [Planctomycetota bacterium]
MTQRERILAIAVGAMMVLGLGQWAFNKYKTAIDMRKTRYESLQRQKMELMTKQEQGALADRQMGEYLVRSLSSNAEQAKSDYQAWLLEVVKKHDLEGAKVVSQRIIPGDLYHQLSFELTGGGDMPQIVTLIHEIQSMDYLHRVRELEIKPASRGGDGFSVRALIDVASITSAPEKPATPEGPSWRTDPDLVAYAVPILNRNLFEPPNRAPAFSGSKTLEAVKGREEAFTLVVKDPEGHNMAYELVDAPEEKVSLDERTGTLRVESDELEELPVTMRVSDDGYPNRSTEVTLLVKVVDPPPPGEKAPEPLKYDDAKQTYLTGLVQGSNDWTAWMNVRTRGKTLKLRVGDEFEVGSVRGQVESIDAEQVVIKIGEQTVTLTSGGVLKEAVDAAAE